jgi:hypothetical protein
MRKNRPGEMTNILGISWVKRQTIFSAWHLSMWEHRHQYGGTVVVVRGKLIHNIEKRGVNESGLGRWCWMQLMGKNGKSTRIISAYALHQPTGTYSVVS